MVLKPGPESLEPGKYFGPSVPRMEGYRPSYYAHHKSSVPFAPCVKESSVSHIFANTKPNVTLPFEEAEVMEGMAESLLDMLSYQEWVSLALARTLKYSDQLCGNTESLNIAGSPHGSPDPHGGPLGCKLHLMEERCSPARFRNHSGSLHSGRFTSHPLQQSLTVRGSSGQGPFGPTSA